MSRVIKHNLSNPCAICNKAESSVDIEIINLTAGDVVGVSACLACAQDIAVRTLEPLRVDQDKLMYTTLGIIGGDQLQTN